MAPTIRIDDDVYAWLQTNAKPFEDTPNSVLRRIAGLEGTLPRLIAKDALQESQVQRKIKIKFDENDRKKVIAEIERIFGTTLKRVGNHRKFLEDPSGKSFWIFGGYDNWHGIPSKMLKEQLQREGDGVLVVAKRRSDGIDIYTGSLQLLVSNRSALSHTKTGDHQFNVSIRGKNLSVREVEGLHLSKMGEAS